MIRSFRHKGLRDLFLTGKSAGVRPDLQKRARRILGALDQAQTLQNLSYPAWGYTRSTGHRSGMRST